MVVVDVLRAEGRRRPYRALDAHCRAQDFDVLVMRDWHRLAKDPRAFQYWVNRVLEAGARLYSVEANWWIDGARDADSRRLRLGSDTSAIETRQYQLVEEPF